MLDAEATLLHKDFAKSKGWQSVFFGAACMVFLSVVVIVVGEPAMTFVEAGFAAIVIGVGSQIGLDVKKMRELLKLPNEKEGKQ